MLWMVCFVLLVLFTAKWNSTSMPGDASYEHELLAKSTTIYKGYVQAPCKHGNDDHCSHELQMMCDSCYDSK